MARHSIDTHWLTAKDFIQKYIKPGERIVAPNRFKHQLANLYAYKITYELAADQFQWVLIHKGMLNAIDNEFLKQTVQTLKPVFANDVFVVFSSRSDVPTIASNSIHIRSLLQHIDPRTAFNNGADPGLKHQLLRPAKQVRRWLSDPRMDGITNQLSMILKRLSALEKSTNKLKQEVRGKTALVHKSTVLAGMSLEELRSVCRANCQTAYLGNNTILCRVLAKYLLYGDTRDIGIVPHLCLNGFWEPWVTLAIMRTLKPGWRCLDVGANHGYYALAMASIVGPEGYVVAVEPNFKLVEMIRKTLEVNGFNHQAVAIAKAVSDKDGEIVKLVVPSGHTGHASIHHAVGETDEVMEAETISIDQLTAQWPQVDFIKIDVEGAEEAVWRGMRQTIRRNQDIVIVLEFGAARYPNPRAFLEEILAEGFILRYIGYDTEPKEISIEDCLSARPNSHWDLFLSRQ